VPAGFDFDRDLTRVGLANQTTMLSGESLAIAAEFRRTMERKHGAEGVEAWVRSFDTICSATQERQDAVELLLQEPLDLMVVVGGYNSSNTCHLAELSSRLGVKTFHIEDAHGVDPDSGVIRHQTVGAKARAEATGWLEGVRTIGITDGASTPNNKIGETVVRICQLAGIDLDEALR
jgi:4-hydroxy-3-methylbut-2-enyl diphosphate reductase